MFNLESSQKVLEEHQAQLKRNAAASCSGSFKATGVQRGTDSARHKAQNARDAARTLQGLDSKVPPSPALPPSPQIHLLYIYASL